VLKVRFNVEKIKENKIETKADLQRLVLDMLEPLKENYSPGGALLKLGENSAHYEQKVAWMEGFARPLFGMVPLTVGGGETSHWEIYLKGIQNGTNPEHKEYWGKVKSGDQLMVEMTTLGLALAMVPEKVWEPLKACEKENLKKWLLQINECSLPENNWLFFGVMVNIGLKKVGVEYNQELIDVSLEKIEESYLSEGWYSDGKTKQRDYYIPFAMHFYGLIYSVLMGKEDPERALKYKERAKKFAEDFIYWFSKEGSALPFGRSLTYRFAMVAFWGALAYANIEVFSWGVMKGILLRNLLWWMKQPIFTREGILSIGYAYPNLKMAEFYNSPGSPNWAMKAFLPLALPDDHPFWKAEEEQLPELEPISVQEHPFMMLCREKDRDHLFALTGGQFAGFQPTYNAAKYGKFAYSTVFGFNVPAGEFGLDQGAFDSTLALCEGDDLYRTRKQCEEVRVEKEYIYTLWKPWRDVEVETWLIPALPWHIRVHRIISNRELIAGEGGFAINCDSGEDAMKLENLRCAENEALAEYPWGLSGVVNLKGSRDAKIIAAAPNTNLLFPRTKIPTLIGNIEKGESWLACAVLGQPKSDEYDYLWHKCPNIKLENNIIAIQRDEAITTITLK
jgi:hypothetical protein